MTDKTGENVQTDKLQRYVTRKFVWMMAETDPDLKII